MTTENKISSHEVSLMAAKIEAESVIDEKPHEYIEALIRSYHEILTARDLKRIALEIHCRRLKEALAEVHAENVNCGSEYHIHISGLLVDLVAGIENA